MPKFVFVQPSLERLGGHYYDFAVHVLHAAEALGFEPILAAHRGFDCFAELPANWRVIPVFGRGESCMRPSRRQLIGGNLPQPLRVLAKLRNWGASRLRRRKWRRRIAEFHRDYRALFRQIDLAPGDQVFCASVGELDLAGLAKYLSEHPRTRSFDWRFLFHGELLEGREHEYVGQRSRLETLQRHFHGVLGPVSRHRLHWFATTERLAAQYDQLELGAFRSIAYPVNPAFRPADKRWPVGRRLRIVCAGGLRDEKGSQQIAQIVRESQQDSLLSESVQFLIQAAATPLPETSNLPRMVPQRSVEYREVKRTTATAVWVPYPLNMADYVDLIRTADVGLFLYDSRRYFARCSGILLETLCSGVPVIVPAGCWLADQIAEPIDHHLEQLDRRLPFIRRVCHAEVDWSPVEARTCQLQNARDVGMGFPSRCSFATVPVAAGTSETLVSFRCDPAVSSGSHVRVAATQRDASGKLLGEWASILGPVRRDHRYRTLIHTAPDTAFLHVAWANAFCDAEIGIQDAEACCYAGSPGRKGHPAGAVGLIAAHPGQVVQLLREMVVHYEHYRSTAEAFARTLVCKHDPAQTLAQLLGDGNPREQLAPAA